KALIYKKILRIASRSTLARCRDITRYFSDKIASAGHRNKTVEQAAAEYLKRPFAQVLGRRNSQNFAAIICHRKSNFGMRESVMGNNARQMIILRGLRAHKFPTRRCIEKQVTDQNGRPPIACSVLYIDQLSAFHDNASGGLIILGFGRKFNLCNRRDRSQSFAAKTECDDLRKIIECPNFGSSMPLECENRIVALHAFAIVHDPHQAATAKFDIDLDSLSARIYRIFNKLFYHGRRT